MGIQQSPSASRDGEPTVTYAVAGLRAPVQILIDHWGIPHIYAESTDDVFFAQGFNAARERLFQLDLWRRKGLGQLAEVFGPDYVDQDRAARLLLYRGDMTAEWQAYGPQTRSIVGRFVAGINAYLDWLQENPRALPPEFELAGYRPARWAPEDVVRPRTHAPIFNLLFEYYRSRVAAAADLESDLVRQKLERGYRTSIPDGANIELPWDVLRNYLLATNRPNVLGPDGGEGSNNWALAADRTTTGRPLLASDPHRGYATPSLRYIAHLSAPGLDVIGAGEPHMPGIALGHNGTAAFGFTIFTIDTEDLVVCDLDTESFETVVETVAVKGEPAQEVELEFSEHGPVIHVDRERGKAYALRSTWFKPGTAPYFGSLEYQTATSWPDFAQALTKWRLPGENHVYADIHGTIAWKAAGLVPRRDGYDRLLPVPANDENHAWVEFRPSSELPGAVDPPQGFVATANQFNVPNELPTPSHEWPDDARYRRILEFLAQQEKHSLEDMKWLQTDQLSVSAREVVEILRENDIAADDPEASKALELLRSWDAVESVDSPAAALFEVWWTRCLGPAVVRNMVRPEAVPFVIPSDPRVVREWLRNPPTIVARDDLVRGTLRQAFEQLAGILGEDSANWRWGDVHQNIQPHALGHLDGSLNVGPVPIGGSGSTVAAASYWAADFSPAVGASFRMVVDVGEWDNSVCINTPGQSGDPRSPHYRDLFETWQKGEYVPMLYSRTKVEEHTEQRITLVPDAGAGPGR